jgi:tetratricopeptide (TPR) repeat protein
LTELSIYGARGIVSETPTVLTPEQADDVASLLADGSSAVLADGDLGAGRERYEMAYRLAQRAEDAEAMALAALGLGGIWVHEHRTAAASVLLETRLRHALPLLDADSSLALRVRARLAAENNYQCGDRAEMLAILDESRKSADPVARAEILSLAHDCLLGPDHGVLRCQLSVQLIKESFVTGRRSDLLLGVLYQTVDLFFDGDPHALRRLGELRELLASEAHLAIGYVVSAIDVMLAIRAGRLDEAEEMSHLCLQRGMAAGDVDALGWHGAQLVAIRWYQGRLAELLPVLEEVAHSPTLSAADNAFRAALAVAAGLSGDRLKASSALAALCGSDLSDLPRSASWLGMMCGIAEAALLLEDRITAKRVYELLSPHARVPMLASPAVCFGSAHHALGVASLACEDLDVAVDHFRAAVRQNLALAHFPAAVASRRRLAEALALRGRPHDAAEAQAELATAAADAATLGLTVPDGDVPQEPGMTVTCTRQGRDWRIEAGERSAVVEHSVGMLHIAVLIANPRQEIAAIDLVAGLATLSDITSRSAASAQPLLDDEAVQAYRRRLARLHDEIRDLESRNEGKRAARERAERDWLEKELASATKIGGRSRSFASDAERARISVGKAIRRALARVTEADAIIGDHLCRTVHTGMRCSYWPA